ncbi:MAG: hypothetical protein JSW08_03030 [archaeon]|nr:MAG: hypothetical protein JSW08_03030 [archaeon]
MNKKDKQKIFELIKELVKRVAGKNNENIAVLLFEKRNVNEFKLADKLKLTINQVRNILYKMLNFNILTYTRKKDKKKGWYTYFWTLETYKALEALKKIKIQERNTLEKLIHSRKVRQYYSCPNDCIELSTETAMHYEFSCPECGELLQLADEKKKIKEIETRVEYLKKELETINHYLKELEPKIEKKEKKKPRKVKRRGKKRIKKKIRRKFKKKKKHKKRKKKVKRKVKKRVKKKPKKKVKKKAKKPKKRSKKKKRR